MTIRSPISSIMGLIGPEHLELFALELEKMLPFTLFTLSIYKYQPISTKLCQNILRSQMNLSMGQIGPQHLELPLN